MLGSGRLKNKIETFVRRNSLDTCVSVVNGSRDPRSYFRQAWVFALSSKREASPNVILEAMASELPIVAPRVGGIPELVREGVNGILFETGNAEQLADALVSLLTDQATRRAMARRGRELVLQRHSIERMISETQQVILDEVKKAFGN
jgi:glycosyltransferase involved in cell wall biosynthesis